jgi:exosome complex RNA-binding protein Rrp4
VSDYKDYEVRVNYNGGIYISALNEEEAIETAKNIMLEETNPDMAKYLTYEVEETILKQVLNA